MARSGRVKLLGFMTGEGMMKKHGTKRAQRDDDDEEEDDEVCVTVHFGRTIKKIELPPSIELPALKDAVGSALGRVETLWMRHGATDRLLDASPVVLKQGTVLVASLLPPWKSLKDPLAELRALEGWDPEELLRPMFEIPAGGDLAARAKLLSRGEPVPFREELAAALADQMGTWSADLMHTTLASHVDSKPAPNADLQLMMLWAACRLFHATIVLLTSAPDDHPNCYLVFGDKPVQASIVLWLGVEAVGGDQHQWYSLPFNPISPAYVVAPSLEVEEKGQAMDASNEEVPAPAPVPVASSKQRWTKIDGPSLSAADGSYEIWQDAANKDVFGAMGLSSQLVGTLLLDAIREESARHALLHDMRQRSAQKDTPLKELSAVETQMRFIREEVLQAKRLVLSRDGALALIASRLGLCISVWAKGPDGKSVFKCRWTAGADDTGRPIRLLMDDSQAGQITTLRLLTGEEVPVFQQADHETRSQFEASMLRVLHYGEDLPAEDQWSHWFGKLKTVGINALCKRYRSACGSMLPTMAPPVKKKKADSESGWFYEYQPLGATETWRRIPVISDASVVLREGVSITGRRPALLFREYLERIGGDNALPQALGEDSRAVELFCIKEGNKEECWLPMECITPESFPEQALKVFLKADLDKVRERFMSLIGQRPARAAIMSQVVSQAVMALVKGEPLSLHEFNMVFVGEPGTGKTTIGQMVADILYYAGLLRIGHLVLCTGASIGQGTGNADQAAPYVRRLYQRARDGVLFIDELYGITAKPGEQASSNQSAAINTITDCALHGLCCTIGAGYAADVEECFFKRNAGLRRRFQTIPFVRFSDWELFQILLLKAEPLWLQMDESAQRVLQWLFAGFTAPDVNGSFVESLARTLRAQSANVGCFAERCMLPRSNMLTPRDVLMSWKTVTRAAWDCETLLGQLKPVWGGDGIAAAEDQYPAFHRIRRDKIAAFSGVLGKAAQMMGGWPLLSTELEAAFESSNDGLLGWFQALVQAHAEAAKRISFGDEVRREVHVVLEQGYKLDPLAVAPSSIISCADGASWDGTTGDPRSCLLFYHTACGSPAVAKDKDGVDVQFVCSKVDVFVTAAEKTITLWQIQLGERSYWIRKHLLDALQVPAPNLRKRISDSLVHTPPRGKPFFIDPMPQISAPPNVRAELVKKKIIGDSSSDLKLVWTGDRALKDSLEVQE
jgi:hypothetical protein